MRRNLTPSENYLNQKNNGNHENKGNILDCLSEVGDVITNFEHFRVFVRFLASLLGIWELISMHFGRFDHKLRHLEHFIIMMAVVYGLYLLLEVALSSPYINNILYRVFNLNYNKKEGYSSKKCFWAYSIPIFLRNLSVRSNFSTPS